MSNLYKKYLKRYEEISEKLSDPKIVSDVQKLKALSREHAELRKIKEVVDKINKLNNSIQENEGLIKEAEETELVTMAEEENLKFSKELKQLRKEFNYLTIARDPDDARNVIVEIRAGAGGDEAGIFAGDIFRMYSRYVERNDFKIAILNASKNNIGGTKEIIAQIDGKDIYGILKHESGVHRVQRIPETEKSGRIHTSTATVAVLPQAEEHDIEIKPEEVKIDTYRSSGPGGQSVNTTDSAIRLTHLPTNLVVTCQDEKSQHKNKAKAFSILRSRLLAHDKEEKQKKASNLRSSQIGTGDRSEKIRTYNFPQDRVTDHRIGQSWHGMEKIMDGEIDDILEALKKQELKLKMTAEENNYSV
ncbi:MAG: peptide chain release factor 1 [Patescibacteria group bacterium]|nr:peptide chain release factor 1 [Patescibacteria group bacterium]